MANQLGSTNFKTADGIEVTIVDYPSYQTFIFTDLKKTTFKASLQKNYVGINFEYQNMEDDGFERVSQSLIRKHHIGIQKFQKQIHDVEEGEKSIWKAVRKVAATHSPVYTALNEISNNVLNIKSATDKTFIPTYLKVIQQHLNFLKSQFPTE